MNVAVPSAASPEAATHGAAATLPALLLERARADGDRVALRHKRLGRWEETTWAQYAARAAAVGLGLRALGVQPGDRVAVHSENRPEWLVCDLGIQGVGAITVGVYPTSPAAEVEYLLRDCGAVAIVCEDEEQLDKALAVRERVPELRVIVVVDTRGVRVLGDAMIVTLAELERRGTLLDGAEFELTVAQVPPAATAMIVYTSGTTGPPKGAMLSQANLLFAGATFVSQFRATPADEVLSYLPLCHVAERLFSVVNGLASGYTVNFGEPGGSLAGDLREVQPTIFLGVPRVWEKMLAGVQIRIGDASWLKRTVYGFWMRRGERIARRRIAGRERVTDRVLYAIGWALLFGSLRDKLGLGRVRCPLSAAAPIAPQVIEFFWTLGVRVREGYGQTENTGIATWSPADEARLGAVGPALEQVELRIAADGEILTRSPGVFEGYWRREQATRETIDADGWLHTGDVGELDGDGWLRITDRKKDIIITGGGKNVSPSEIENRLKVSPFVREAIVIGDRRPYLTALVEIEGDTVGDWASRRRLAYTTYADLADRREVRELVQGVVDEANGELAQVEQIKRFALLDKELDQDDGELTATQKVKRAAIAERFEALIEGLYRR
ncbi:MAG: AMP-dependent synthetase/ligase [Solirubrobacteraceae bacterium]